MRRRTRGFTLIEMTVSVVLLAIGAVAALSCIASGTNAVAVSAEYTTATLLAGQKMAEARQQADSLTGGEQQGEFGEQYPGYSWVRSAEATEFDGLFKITLTISWRSGMARRTAAFVTYQRATSAMPAAATTAAGGTASGG